MATAAAAGPAADHRAAAGRGRRTLRALRSDIAVAVSGVAGPTGGTLTKPVGMVCIGWGLRDGSREARTYRFAGDRDAVRRQTVIEALAGVIRLCEAPAGA